MAMNRKQQKAQAAWDRIEALGGHGVWEVDTAVVVLAATQVTDDDLALFNDFPFVQILDLSKTDIGDRGLRRLSGLPSLTDLILTDTKISKTAIEAFRKANPNVRVKTKPPPKGMINPFTRKPFE